jgi:hypothetical protein
MAATALSRESDVRPLPPAVTQEALMLFAPQMAQLLATSARRRHQAPTAPRRRRDLLRGLRFPRRSMRAVAAGRLLHRARTP